MSQFEVIVTRDRDALGDRAASLLERLILEAGDGASLALSGGETPLGAYRHLASRPVPWGRVQVFFTSETCVPADAEASNYNLVSRAIIDRIPVKQRQVHRIRGVIAPERAAVEAVAAMHENLPGAVPSLVGELLGRNRKFHVLLQRPATARAEGFVIGAKGTRLRQPGKVPRLEVTADRKSIRSDGFRQHQRVQRRAGPRMIRADYPRVKRSQRGFG